MKTISALINLSTTLSQNTSGANQSLSLTQMNSQHRLSLQKYFDNEREFQTTTVGGMALTTTAPNAINAISATLTVSWAYPTCQQLVTFSDGDQRTVIFTNGSTAISWVGGLVNNSTTAVESQGVQSYTIPAQISKITSEYIQVGQLRFVPVPIHTRVDWDRVNFLPYTSDIVNYVFIYGGQIKFWPIPSTTGDIIQFNYKARVPDFSFIYQGGNTAWTQGNIPTDYTLGTVTPPAVGGTSITGVSTAWNTTGGFPLNTDVSYFNLFFRIDPPKGDGIWYPIAQFNSDTSLTLASAMQHQSSSSAGATYSIGQMPLLQEDFHDMLPYWFLLDYFSTIVPDTNKYKQIRARYDELLELLSAYAGTKSILVDLDAEPVLSNPNNYPYANP